MKQNERRYRVIVVLTAVFLAVYAVWRLGFTVPAGTVPLICWIILTAVEALGIFELAVFVFEFVKRRSVPLPDADERDFPDVDVFIFTINESEDLLEKTVYACTHMRYPDPSKVHVWLCDDGTRDSVRALAERLGAGWLTREDHSDAKAGNFNHAFVRTVSPYIAIFDADMMPKENFLMKTVPYLLADEKAAFVQTPQHFYRKDIFQRGLPKKDLPHNEQDYFYQVIQETKNSSNSVILAGSNTLLRRSAIGEIGGFVTGSITEDFATGIELQKHGYRGVSVTEVLADGLPPMDFADLVKQRRRWARGCIQSGRITKYVRSKTLSLRQKINCFISIIYWYSSVKRLVYMLAPMLFCLAGIGVMRCEPWEIALFWFPIYFFINLCVYLFSGKIRSLYWTNIYETVMMPYLLPSVIQEALGFKKKVFEVTSKKQPGKGGAKTARYLAPYLVLLALTLLSLGLILFRTWVESSWHYVLLIVYLLINCWYLLTACRIVAGSAANVEGAMFGIKEAVEYREVSGDRYVPVRTSAMGEYAVSTATYDDAWTEGVLRIPGAGVEIPVRYEKGGVWSIDPEAAGPDAYDAYIYHIFNRQDV